jgi:hypothetical protein
MWKGQTMTPETREQQRSHLGRRSLVRAGVWAVPVVGIVAAAPAIAASVAQSNLGTSTNTHSRNNAHKYTVTVVLNNTGAGATTGLQVVATASGGVDSITAPSGWNRTGATSVATSQIAAGGTLTTVFTVNTSSNNPANITLLFTTSNGGTYTISFAG